MDDTQELGRAIRELLGPYSTPVDAYDRVARRVRARQTRRATIAAAATASVALAVAAVVAIAPAGEVAVRSVEAAAPPPPPATGNQFAEFGFDSPLGPAFIVGQGSVNGQDYIVASTTFGLGGAACLFASDAVFTRLSWCSSAEKSGHLGEWDELAPVRAEADAVAVGGTVAVHIRTVIIRTTDGRELPVSSVRTPTSSSRAYFLGVLPGADTDIADVVAAVPDGSWVVLPRTAPDGRCVGGTQSEDTTSEVVLACSSSTDSGRRS